MKIKEKNREYNLQWHKNDLNHQASKYKCYVNIYIEGVDRVVFVGIDIPCETEENPRNN